MARHRRSCQKNNLKIRGWHANGCPPLFDVQLKLHGTKLTSLCNQVINLWSNYIRENRPGIVILAARWPTFYELRENYGMNERRNRQLLLSTDNPIYTREASREVFASQLAFTVNEILALDGKVILFSQAPEPGVNPWDCSDIPTYLITMRKREERCQFVKNGKPLYKDFLHLNGSGSRHAAQQIEKEFNEFVSK